MNKEKIENEVKRYILFLSNLVSTKKKKKEIRPIVEQIQIWKIDGFKYGENGVERSCRRGGYIKKESWLNSVCRLEGEVKHHLEYETFKRFLQKDYGEQHATHILNQTTFRALKLLCSKKRHVKEHLIESLIRDLLDKPNKALSKVELLGLVLEPKFIKLSPSIIIRQVKKEDLEVPIESITFGISTIFKKDPSAILVIESYLKKDEVRKLQTIVEKTICILRLMKVGSIRFEKYSIKSDSLMNFFEGTTLLNIKVLGEIKSYIRKKEVRKFKKLYESISKKNIEQLCGSKAKTTSTKIAYDFYVNALLEKGTIERKISDVIMGFEALYSNDNKELTFKLSLRIAKLMSILGFKPQKVKSEISDGYFIRNKFAHGSILKEKDRKKYDGRYGSLKNLRNKLMDYLRVGILVMILEEIKKDTLIALIDDSFLKSDVELNLRKKLTDVSKVIYNM